MDKKRTGWQISERDFNSFAAWQTKVDIDKWHKLDRLLNRQIDW